MPLNHCFIRIFIYRYLPKKDIPIVGSDILQVSVTVMCAEINHVADWLTLAPPRMSIILYPELTLFIKKMCDTLSLNVAYARGYFEGH